MNLVIAEKPSVAQSIAKVIGATTKHDGYLEGSGYLVSWCVGHLVELAEPEEYDGKYEKWRKEDLPIIPSNWEYQISLGTKKQYQILKELLFSEQVDCVTNACDAGREGEHDPLSPAPGLPGHGVPCPHPRKGHSGGRL